MSAAPWVSLGVDVGTTRTKTVAVDATGRVRGSGSVPTPWDEVATGRETSAERLWTAIEASLAAAVDEAGAAGRVAAVGLTSMGQSGTCVGADGTALLPVVCWDDVRAEAEADRLREELGAGFAAITGRPVATPWTVNLLARLSRTDGLRPPPGATWLGVADYAAFRLTGRRAAEPSMASETGLLDVVDGTWSDTLLAWAGWPAAALPPLLGAGEPLGRAGEGPAAGAVVTLAGHDHLVAAHGSGAVEPGDVFDSCGTAETVVRTADVALDRDALAGATRRGLRVGRHLRPDLAAVTASWPLSAALEATRRSVLARHGWDPAARDAPDAPVPEAAEQWWVGLVEQARTTAEAVEALDAWCGPRRRVVLAGGWTRVPAFARARRHVLGEVDVATAGEPGALGAALMGAEAAGLRVEV